MRFVSDIFMCSVLKSMLIQIMSIFGLNLHLESRTFLSDKLSTLKWRIAVMASFFSQIWNLHNFK